MYSETTKRTPWLVVLCLGTIALTGALGVAAPVTQTQETPTVSVSNVSVDAGNQTTTNVTLSSAPNGIAGYSLTLGVNGTANVTVGNVTFPGGFDLSTVENRTNQQVTLRAVDLTGSIASGEENVSLAGVEIAGQTPGNATLTVTVNQFDDPTGNEVAPQNRSGRIQVFGVNTTDALVESTVAG